MENEHKITIRDPINFVEKGWGNEIWIVNGKYCGKILNFNKGAQFSDHFHILKTETFFLMKGKLELKTIDLSTASPEYRIIEGGQVIDIPTNCPHQIKALEESVVIEFSTEHFDSDSYRIGKGDSQKS
jgi:hypothetical protein